MRVGVPMKGLGLAVIAATLLVAPLQAQDTPKVDIAVGYSPLYIIKGLTIWTNGVSGSAAFYTNHWFGVVGDFGVYHGFPSSSLTGETYMAGPRFTYRKLEKAVPFAQNLFFQALFGGSHFSASTSGITGGANEFAFALGGGVDVGLGSRREFALRPQGEYVGIRSGGSITPATRLSIALVYRFGKSQ